MVLLCLSCLSSSPSIHPFSSVCLEWWQQAEQGSPDTPFSSNVFQLLLGGPEAFPSQMSNLSSVFWVYRRVSYKLDVPRKPPEGGTEEAT